MFQAAGYAIAVAIYTPTCGPDSQLVWALAMCWLLAVPVCFTFYMIYKLTVSKATKEIRFQRKKHAGSWLAYISKIYKAEGSQEEFCRPHIVHYVIKMFLGLTGALLLFVAISLVPNPSSNVVQTVLLFVFGFISLLAAILMSYMPGRRVVVALTNIISSHLGKNFIIVKGGAVLEVKTKPNSCLFGCCAWTASIFVSCAAWIQAKVETMFDPANLWSLSHRGKWVKKDALKVYYSELNDRGIYFAVFLMIKNVLIGITLADSPSLVGTVQKVTGTSAHVHATC